MSPLTRGVTHASAAVLHPSNEVSARLLTPGRVDSASGMLSHAHGLGNRNQRSEGSHLPSAAASPPLQRSVQLLEVPQSRAQSPRAQHQPQGNNAVGVRVQPAPFGGSVHISLPVQGDSHTRQQQRPRLQQRLHRLPRARIHEASSSRIPLSEDPLFLSLAGRSGMVGAVVQQSAQARRHAWVQAGQLPSQLPIESDANAASASRARSCEESEDQCVVCLSAEKTHAFVPCGHRCVCRSCGSELLKEARPCPICRAQAQSLLQIFV